MFLYHHEVVAFVLVVTDEGVVFRSGRASGRRLGQRIDSLLCGTRKMLNQRRQCGVVDVAVEHIREVDGCHQEPCD